MNEMSMEWFREKTQLIFGRDLMGMLKEEMVGVDNMD